MTFKSNGGYRARRIITIRVVLFIVGFLFYPISSVAQLILYQDIFNGGITGGGFSTYLGSGTGQIELHVTENSTIRRAYLICQRFGHPTPAVITINSVPYIFDGSNQFSQNYDIPNASSTGLNAVHVIDITDNFASTEQFYEITIPMQSNTNAGDRYGAVYLFVAYENPNMDEIAGSIAINNQDLNNYENYNLQNINPISIFNPVGFAIHSDRLRDTLPPPDGSLIYINEQFLGLIGGADNANLPWQTGVMGHFYYQNSQLFGLDDDVPNNSMGGSDGLANISEFVWPSSTHLQVDLKWQNSIIRQAYNIYISFHLAYTTPCQPFETTVTDKVENYCGDTVQLQATGGIAYEWLPQQNLSCYDCPNPIYEGDSSTFYTVRIWNTDSCSKVLPVKINIYEPLQSVNLTTTPATCGENDGALAIGAVNGGQGAYQYRFDENWISNPTSYVFSQLAAGEYTLSVKDQNNCYLHQPFTIGEVNPAEAAFTASPPSGHAPLEVDFINQSNGSTDYEWSLADSAIYSFDFSYTFDSAGSYPVQLVSWYNLPHCADTAATTVLVYPQPPDYSHTLTFPTDYNPQHGLYAVETTNIERMEWQVYNAVGQHIYSTNVETPNGSTALWDGGGHARGYYFFRVRYWDVEGTEHTGRGKVLLMR